MKVYIMYDSYLLGIDYHWIIVGVYDTEEKAEEAADRMGLVERNLDHLIEEHEVQ